MTEEQYRILSEEISRCRVNVVRSFEKLDEAMKHMTEETVKKINDLADETNAMTQHVD